ncbi:MAG: HAD family hydrolase [Oscillospiraceae bacterium]|nr:HAD family hydrolase [Oscillospiraceae bacterium]
MITTVLFDLDGTLLPMDQDRFVQSYLGRMAKKLAPQGFDPDLLVKSIWKGTGAMVKNDGKQLNEAVFWEVFNATLGKDCKVYEELFLDYYRNEFQSVASDCGFAPEAAQVISMLKEKGLQVGLATNPLFPAIATQSRAKWAGLDPSDFAIITTYENSRYCKPNPDYYRDILATLDVKPENCLMVGNDVQEDMVARELGMAVFLLTHSLINRTGEDISAIPQGGFPELMTCIREL